MADPAVHAASRDDVQRIIDHPDMTFLTFALPIHEVRAAAWALKAVTPDLAEFLFLSAGETTPESETAIVLRVTHER